MKINLFVSAFLVSSFALTASAAADPFFFSTGNPNGLMAAASRPSSAGAFEIESADDFVLTTQTAIDSATFTGLLTAGSTAANVEQRCC